MYFVYILELSNGDYYTGLTSDVEKRVSEHKSGKSYTTKRFLPVSLVSFTALRDKNKAEKFERYLKTGSGIAFRNRHLV